MSRRRERIAIVLPGLGVAGGIHILLRWAQLLGEDGRDVAIVVPETELGKPLPFVAESDARFRRLGLAEAQRGEYDVVFATWWDTIPAAQTLRAETHALFVQGLDSQFFAADDPRHDEYTALITSGLPILCIAHWLERHFVDVLGLDAGRVRVVLNPLDKAQWRPVAPRLPKGGKLRFMVEGPLDDARKCIPQTLALLEEQGCEYLWVGAQTDRAMVTRNCVGAFARVPYEDMPAMYASADVLVKLSTAEGMFGPPLEMFATGGTAIVWDVWGAEEYVRHDDNALVVPMKSLEGVRAAIARLKADRTLVERLKRGAQATVAAWPDWQESCQEILEAVDSLAETEPRFRDQRWANAVERYQALTMPRAPLWKRGFWKLARYRRYATVPLRYELQKRPRLDAALRAVIDEARTPGRMKRWL
jgi:hypothetical protein